MSKKQNVFARSSAELREGYSIKNLQTPEADNNFG